ncbi:hypothetical protein BGZ95_003733 [Linnemannia exigua]|uniref:Uncharacterized protein n=1 Tax=Linnemannia exigua TaxID=604196 RepID=A0AAD4HAA9_9FUNG|nr:hypothetical protein BGZ95_003733 [Linnemannia exigua]
MSHRRASTTSSISSFFDPSREIDSFASPVRGGMVFSEPQTSSSSSSSRPPTSSTASRPPPAAAPKPTSTLTSSLNNANNNYAPQPVVSSSVGAAPAPVPVPKQSSSHSRNSSLSSAGGAVPLSVSIPRQRSFSSSFSLATGGIPISAGAPSPRTFTGSSIISNPNSASFPGPANPFALGAFTPLSPTSSSPPGSSVSVSQSVPVLHRRFSSSFNQLNQIVSPSTVTGGAQSNERGRRTSMFGGNSPPTSTTVSIQTANSNTDNNNSVSAMGGGLFRKFSTSGRSNAATTTTPAVNGTAGHPFDRNDAGPTVAVTPQPSSNQHQQQYGSSKLPPGTQDSNGHHLTTAVDKLKPSYDKTPRSSSPMRSMILNGQMLD